MKIKSSSFLYNFLKISDFERQSNPTICTFYWHFFLSSLCTLVIVGAISTILDPIVLFLIWAFVCFTYAFFEMPGVALAGFILIVGIFGIACINLLDAINDDEEIFDHNGLIYMTWERITKKVCIPIEVDHDN